MTTTIPDAPASADVAAVLDAAADFFATHDWRHAAARAYHPAVRPLNDDDDFERHAAQALAVVAEPTKLRLIGGAP